MTAAEGIRRRLGQIVTEIRLMDRNLDALEAREKRTRDEIEAEWSHVLDLLHPHRTADESIFETAKRIIPKP